MQFSILKMRLHLFCKSNARLALQVVEGGLNTFCIESIFLYIGKPLGNISSKQIVMLRFDRHMIFKS